jgi:flavin-dependent dehydrogenase
LLLAPRRHVLDQLLVDAAVAAGARLTTGVTVTGLRRDTGGRVSGVVGRHAEGGRVELAARYVVGADGVRSRVARAVGATVQDSFPADTATFYTYVTGDWPAYEFHTAHNAFAGVFPTHCGQACVWLIRPVHAMRQLRTAGAGRAAALLRELDLTAPHLARRVRAGRVTAPVRGAVRLPNHVRVPVGPGWALAGDAGYHRDPITGHGITDAFRDAELLAGALGRSLNAPDEESDAMAAYHSRRDAALREVFDLTRSLAAFPHPDHFVELQIQLGEALEREADDLASLPAVAGSAAGAAA